MLLCYCICAIGRRCGSVGISFGTNYTGRPFVTYHPAYGRMGVLAILAVQRLAVVLFQTKVSGIFSSFHLFVEDLLIWVVVLAALDNPATDERGSHMMSHTAGWDRPG